MQRETWTDERLDDMARHVGRRFDQVDQRFNQVDQRFDRVEGDIRDLRTEMRSEFGTVRGEIGELRTLIHRFGAGLFATIIIAAVLQHSI